MTPQFHMGFHKIPTCKIPQKEGVCHPWIFLEEDMNQKASSGLKNKRRMSDFFMQNKLPIDYRDADILRRFLSPEGKILPARRSGLTAKNQRKLTNAIKRGRMISLLPFVSSEF